MTDFHILYKLRGHRPVGCKDVVEWGRWFEKADRAVQVTTIGAGETAVRVSTVFLGIDHSAGLGRKPILFETMVFGGEMDGEQERYETWAEAERGHRAMVMAVKDREL